MSMTTLSTKGQVVIPVDVRRQAGRCSARLVRRHNEPFRNIEPGLAQADQRGTLASEETHGRDGADRM